MLPAAPASAPPMMPPPIAAAEPAAAPPLPASGAPLQRVAGLDRVTAPAVLPDPGGDRVDGIVARRPHLAAGRAGRRAVIETARSRCIALLVGDHGRVIVVARVLEPVVGVFAD